MNLNESILSEVIYVGSDTNILKFSVHTVFNLRVEERRRLPSQFSFLKRCLFRMDYPTKRLYEIPF